MPGVINLSDLNGSDGFAISGISGSALGGAVSGAGDVNGDGIDDFIIGASSLHANDQLRVGQSYVIFGNADGFPDGIDLNGLNGINGFSVTGVDAEDGSGFSVSGAGDINGDGFDDIIIGAQNASPDGRSLAGESYVVFGGLGGFPAEVNLSSLNGVNGFVIIGRNSEDEGQMRVSAAGDINGDGIDDIIVGASAVDTSDGTVRSNQGESYVIFGTTDGFAAQFDLRDLDGNNGFAISGDNAGDVSGISVSAAGDINGDGIDDIIIGAIGVGIGGAAYVVYGSDQGFAATLSLGTINGENGFVLAGLGSMDRAGQSVSGAGDVNGDGIDDIIVAAFADSGGLSGVGTSYVIFGSANGFPQDFNLAGIDGTNGFAIGAGDQSGHDVSAAGDVNGDGFGDIIIGAKYADPDGNDRAGASYIVFGSGAGFPASVDLSSLDGSNGFVVNGIVANDYAGSSVSAAGDINGDGYADILIGAPGVGPDGFVGFGAAYVIFGAANIGQQGVRIVGNEDAEVIFGTSDDDTLDGGRGSDTLNGGDGDDLLRGGTQADVLDGGAGNDNLLGGNGNDTIVGGSGNDTLSGSIGDDSLAGGGGGDRLFGDAGADTLNGGGGSDRVDYLKDDADLLIDLETGEASGGFAEGDVLISIESVFGGTGNDTLRAIEGGSRLNGAGGDDLLVGRSGDDIIAGGNGNDTIVGSAGADLMSGNRGIDLIDYSNSSAAVSVNLILGTASGGDAEGDTLIRFTDIRGSDFADNLAGNNQANRLEGGAGDDTLTGGGRADTFVFTAGGGDDTVNDFGRGSDLLDLSATTTDFTDLASVQAAATEQDGGLLIDLGGGDSLFLIGVATADLSASSLVL